VVPEVISLGKQRGTLSDIIGNTVRVPSIQHRQAYEQINGTSTYVQGQYEFTSKNS
jgi:hypothetical protein